MHPPAISPGLRRTLGVIGGAFWLALALAAIAVAGASAARAAALGATVQSRVYVNENPSLRLWNRSTVMALFKLGVSGGWTVNPAEVVLLPDEQLAVTVEGEGDDGAYVAISVTAVEPPPAGEQRSELVLEARIYHERPGSPLPVVLALLAAVIIAGMVVAFDWRRRNGRANHG